MPNRQDIVLQDLEYITGALAGELTALEAKRILVTGGAGFLGYYFVQSILHWNDTRPGRIAAQVTVHDNFRRGRPRWLDQLADRPDLEVVDRDVTRPAEEAPEGFHYIVHAASIASPTYYRKYPIETMDANVNGLRYLLEQACRRKGRHEPLCAFLYLSSSEIYGDPDPSHIPTRESYNGNVSCTGPRACYDESKRYGETLCVNFARQHDLPVRIARPFNNYGPGLKLTDGRILPDLVRNVLAGEDITLLSDGSPTRTFCYVADAIVGYFKILLRGRDGEAYNIGNDSPEISMRQLAEIVRQMAADLLEYRGKVVFARSRDRDYLTDNPNRRCPDINKARGELDFAPCISINDGITRSLIWYSEDANARDAQ